MMLLQAVVGSMIIMNKRRTMESIPPSLRQLWKEWELRVMILLSLTTQIVLVILGNRRKYIAGTWIRIIVWTAYLLADSVAIMAAGILSNNLGDICRKDSFGPEYELLAFWAPMMLLHLGGTDAITAYSLEDNELWKRHSFGVVAQAMTTMYIFVLAWTSSLFSLLFVVMFYVGLVKYCERVWVLYWASDNKFRDSIPDIPSSESKVVEECRLKQMEGYHVTPHQTLEVDVPNHLTNNIPSSSLECVPYGNELLAAYGFLEMVKRLFADLVIGFQDGYATWSIFANHAMSASKAFRIIEIELGLIYDLRYTKAKIVYSAWGIAGRFIGIFLTLIVLLMVSLHEIILITEKHRHHSKIDRTITLVLLAAALLVELWAFLQLILSDQTAYWLIKRKNTTILRVIKCISHSPLTNWAIPKRRWSNSIAQFSLLKFASRENPLPCLRVQKMLGIEEFLDTIQYKSTPISLSKVDLRGRIFKDIHDSVRRWTERYGYDTNLKAIYGQRGGRTIEWFNDHDLEWSVELEFDQSILTWHLATEIMYYQDREPNEIGNCLSRYMLYLLVEHPYMLPLGMAHIKFRDIYAGLGDFLEKEVIRDNYPRPRELIEEGDSEDEAGDENEDKEDLDATSSSHASGSDSGGSQQPAAESRRSGRCWWWLKLPPPAASRSIQKQQKKKDPRRIVDMLLQKYGQKKLERSNSVILHGCKLASLLGLRDNRWEIIDAVWMEMLCHAASQCSGRYHAQQLRRGGEFHTHVWLLMAHFGLNDHFQVIPRSRAMADAVLR
ncbi:hypothetical protein CsSME_00016477 [Camellia sinensis var. sinensis]